MAQLLALLSGAIRGLVAGLLTSILGAFVGGAVEHALDRTVVSWEMAGFFVMVFCAVGGAAAGCIGAALGKPVAAALIGLVGMAAILGAIVATNGAPMRVAIWSVSVGLLSGAAAGACGTTAGSRRTD